MGKGYSDTPTVGDMTAANVWRGKRIPRSSDRPFVTQNPMNCQTCRRVPTASAIMGMPLGIRLPHTRTAGQKPIQPWRLIALLYKEAVPYSLSKEDAARVATRYGKS